MTIKDILLVIALICLPGGGSITFAAERPNVLIIMADDCTHNDLPLYSGQNAKTPFIDQLAKEGLTFNKAYLAEAMCQPCRAELFSGLYPMTNGCAWNHSASRPEVTSMPHHLGAAGYRVGLSGKLHVKPNKAFRFEQVPGFDPNCVRAPTQQHQTAGIRRFMARDSQQPFCLVVALVEPHVPWVMGDASAYPTEKLKLPPNLADTAKTREDFASYLAEISYMDAQVGEILAALKASGAENDTLVLFTSEQGSQFPGNKWTCWDTGVHTGLIARWPGKIVAGQRTDAMVQYADVLPTLLAAAAVEPKAGQFDGTSFLPVLLGERDTHRQVVFGLHNNIPEGPRYPVRTVTDGRYRYIRNLLPEEIYIEKHLMGLMGGSAVHNPYWSTWIRESFDHPRIYDLVKRYMRRPAEELYDTMNDPYEINNLIGNTELAEVHARLKAELETHMAAQGDPGAPQDTHEAIQAARRGAHLYGPHVEKVP